MGATEADEQALMRCWQCFEDLPRPTSNSWLHHRSKGATERSGQTMSAFAPHNVPLPHRSAIYLVPVCDVAGAPPLDELVAIVHACYSLPVRLLPLSTLPTKAVESVRQRAGADFGPQLEASDVLSLLERHKPRDAFALVGFTMLDIHDRRSRAPIYGQAVASRGVGVFSFARHRVVRSTVTIGDQVIEGYVSGTPDRATFMRRCAMTLCHEIGHLLGIHHCIFARCLMNGSNHLAEAEARPFQLCPLDTKKWLRALRGAKLEGGLDLTARERAMHTVFERSGLAADAALSRRRLSALKGMDATVPVDEPTIRVPDIKAA